ncbi:GIY-YIG nuclease family protein [Candidatus Microgenomates bacterium]|nr:GIY-YIG nuclease family protein [Candidatus Microgenomates bacterium]
MFTTYILQSERDRGYYIGSTDNIEKRIIQHNRGYSRYTKNRGPFKLIYQETYSSRSEAKKREYYLKSLKSRIAIEKLINAAIV